jgi:hypothetical protein
MAVTGLAAIRSASAATVCFGNGFTLELGQKVAALLARLRHYVSTGKNKIAGKELHHAHIILLLTICGCHLDLPKFLFVLSLSPL